MTEYIKKEDALKILYDGEEWFVDVSRAYERINKLSPADVAQVRHGRWIHIRKHGEYECSVCHGIDVDCSDYYCTHVVTEQDYCPYCGAKMDIKE